MIDPIQQELGRTTPFNPAAHANRSSHVPAANLTYAYAGFGAVLGILFGVATAATLHQAGQTAQLKPAPAPTTARVSEASVVHASFALPEEKDMGSVNSHASGLRGHLSTTWSEKLGYHFVVSPSDPEERDAFALTVSDPPRPISVNVELKAAAGQVLCNQEVVVKYDPRKAGAAKGAQLDQLEAKELDREHSKDVFQNDLDKDGKVESISSRGTIPCSKPDYDSAAYWSFTPQFPDLHQQARILRAVEPVVAKSTVPQIRPVMKLAAFHPTTVAHELTPAAPKVASMTKVLAAAKTVATPEVAASIKTADVVAEVQKPAAFHFEIEGDDEIVDFDATQKSLETSAGKTFFVAETLAPSNVAGWLDVQANVHYRCDEKSSCTLSLASTTLLHATMRAHHGSFAQPEMLSLNGGQDSSFDGPVGPESLGH